MEERNTLLIVDDFEFNRLMLSDTFSDRHVVEAENGKRAIEEFEKMQLMIGEIIEFLFKGSAPAYYNMGAALSLVLMLLILLCIAAMNSADKSDDEIGGMMP